MALWPYRIGQRRQAAPIGAVAELLGGRRGACFHLGDNFLDSARGATGETRDLVHAEAFGAQFLDALDDARLDRRAAEPLTSLAGALEPRLGAIDQQ